MREEEKMEALLRPEEIKVGIADWKTAVRPARLITLGLGSCVGVALYDKSSKIGGLAHIMLPNSGQFSEIDNRAKFADLAIPDLLQAMFLLGARRSHLTAKLAGGAQMFTSADKNLTILNIGERNAQAAQRVLTELGIKVLAAETGGNYGRTMILDTASGEVFIRTIGRPLKII